MGELSDTQVRSSVRGILARHWIDLQRTSFTCARGIVRFGGKAARRGETTATAIGPNQLENLESDLRRTRGVVRAHFEFENWRRLECGQWVQIERQARLGSVTDLVDGESESELELELVEEPDRPG